MNTKSRIIFETGRKIPTSKPKKYSKIEPQLNQSIIFPKNEVDEENTIYVSQLQELARVFSSSDDRHIRQYIINVAKGILERAGDYKNVEAYVEEVLS
jgi:antitoxin component YwqK of YwqJK toxin-antitoxin module